ncbi:hypothetical protein KAR91_38660 [Candidatus Pacearchaeota archaeon]|nr:hypothetical protein [Candidatus Pacearchaeota archaeon]
MRITAITKEDMMKNVNNPVFDRPEIGALKGRQAIVAETDQFNLSTFAAKLDDVVLEMEKADTGVAKMVAGVYLASFLDYMTQLLKHSGRGRLEDRGVKFAPSLPGFPSPQISKDLG